MARSTSLIAVAGALVLAVGIGAVALRGTGDDEPDTGPTTASTATDTPTGGVTDTGAPTEPVSPSPTDDDRQPVTRGHPEPHRVRDRGTAPHRRATDTATDAPSGSDSPTGSDAPTGSEDDDEGTALGPTGDIEDTPNTGGGALSALGAAVAAGAVMVGRRQRD